ncbi:MAG: hypothetical protein QM775_19310 [Pirellulales bacterium]
MPHVKNSSSSLLAALPILGLLATYTFVSLAPADDAVIPVKNSAAIVQDAAKLDAPKNGKGPKHAQGFTPEREAAALTFVRAHHAELADLLDRLKTRRPQEYQKAIRELFRASERLAQSQEQQPQRYELELNEWKLQSRIQLLVARMSMNRTPEIEAELRSLLTEQIGVHRELVKFTHERAAARAAALQKELELLDGDRADMVERRFQEALKTAGQKKPPTKTGPAKAGATASRPKSKDAEQKSAEEKKSEPQETVR